MFLQRGKGGRVSSASLGPKETGEVLLFGSNFLPAPKAEGLFDQSDGQRLRSSFPPARLQSPVAEGRNVLFWQRGLRSGKFLSSLPFRLSDSTFLLPQNYRSTLFGSLPFLPQPWEQRATARPAGELLFFFPRLLCPSFWAEVYPKVLQFDCGSRLQAHFKTSCPNLPALLLRLPLA